MNNDKGKGCLGCIIILTIGLLIIFFIGKAFWGLLLWAWPVLKWVLIVPVAIIGYNVVLNLISLVKKYMINTKSQPILTETNKNGKTRTVVGEIVGDD